MIKRLSEILLVKYINKYNFKKMPRDRGSQGPNGSTGLDDVWIGVNGLSGAIENIFRLEFDSKRHLYNTYAVYY